MRIRVFETRDGSEDGITSKTFEGGQVHDMADRLARIFIAEGWGVEVVAEAKDAGAAPENREAGPAAENKAKPRRKKKAS